MSSHIDPSPYVSLHNRSAWSFGSSVIRPEQLAGFAAAHRMPAIALTDVNGLYAAVDFQQACERAGVRPIFGAELALAEGVPVTLLAQDAAGYGHLCRLISLHHLRESPLGLADIREHAAGLICLIGRTVAPSSLEAIIPSLREALDRRLYVELALHTPDDYPLMRHRARVADEAGVPVAATGESRCARPEQALLLRALSSIGTLTLLDSPHPDKPSGAWHLRTPAEMRWLFHRRPDALASTRTIAERCHAKLDLSRNRFPRFEAADGRPAIAHLRERCAAGCRRRYVENPPLRGMGGRRPTLAEALARLDRELKIIEQVGYAEYFLVFDEIVRYCRAEAIATLARGSAADSLVCYALGVSHACPFRFDLPFDRFLNPERARFSKMADVDLDLPWDRRDQVIGWVYERWGHDRVAMIGAPNTYHARAAVAELGKVFGLPTHEVHRATKLLHHATSGNLPKAIRGMPEARGFPLDEEPYRTILRWASKLEGLPHHWSMHPCGLVVSPEPLTELVPVERSAKGPLVAQYEMDAIEALGFIKIDLIGQAGLSVLRDTVAEVGRTDGITVDLDRDVDYAEPATWESIATGNARGVHHIESPAMTSLLRQCNCRDIDCLTAVVAIIRPGAANQGKKDAFARRHQGLEPPQFAHPLLAPVLAQSYGLMVFEEHILQIAVGFAGMNIGQADVLRRALNKENRPLVEAIRADFFRGARRQGRDERAIEAVWSLIEGFAGFMFNKAHSAEFAIEAFQGAWLKRRWPAHYLAAVLSNYRGFYAHSPTLPQILYVLEARRLGIGFLPPCVNRSREHFSVEDAGPDHRLMIRIPITHIAGLSRELLGRWLAERQQGPFVSATDFMTRCRPGENETRLLLDSGALDGWQISRPALFWNLRRWFQHGASQHRGLWHHDGEQVRPPVELTVPDARAIAQREMELLGFPVTIDPLAFLGADGQGRPIDWSRYTPLDQLDRHHGRRINVCGLLVADRINAAHGGGLMKFVTLADATGFVEAFLFPEAYRRFGYLTAAHLILAASGVVEPFENDNGCTLRVDRLDVPASVRPAGCRSHIRQIAANNKNKVEACWLGRAKRV